MFQVVPLLTSVGAEEETNSTKMAMDFRLQESRKGVEVGTEP